MASLDFSMGCSAHLIQWIIQWLVVWPPSWLARVSGGPPGRAVDSARCWLTDPKQGCIFPRFLAESAEIFRGFSGSEKFSAVFFPAPAEKIKNLAPSRAAEWSFNLCGVREGERRAEEAGKEEKARERGMRNRERKRGKRK